MAETVKSVMQGLPDAFQPDAAAGVDAIFQYEVTGDQASTYHLVVKDQKLTINEGAHSSPNCTLTMDTPDFIDLMTGKIDGMSAFMAGKLKVDGDLMLAQTLATLFKN